MLTNAVRGLWAEPRAPNPPARVWRDWVLVAVLLPTAVLEGLLREDVVWGRSGGHFAALAFTVRPVALVMGVGVVCSLLWRRTHPLAAVAGAFGALIVADIASLMTAGGPVGLYTMGCVLLLPYSLVRWGSGREIGIGLAIILVALVMGLVSDFTGVLDSVVGSMILLFPATLGAAVRYWATSRMRELDQVRLREREQLARELHDTVAHHVSAIAIRAQAGRVVAAADPTAALDALAVIEEEASRTLAEMRIMVGGLRDNGSPVLVPQPGVADLERLARSVGDRPRVELKLSGDLDNLGSSIGTAIYRIAQESVTNAVRHARHATRIDVRVAGDPDCVRLTVSRQRRCRLDRPEPAGLRADRDDRTGDAPRRLPGGRSRSGPRLDRRGDVAQGGQMTVRVLVADDQDLIRTGLAMILDAQPDIEVVGQAADGHEAVALARRLRPDVCLFDIRMPGMDGIAATRELAGPGVDDPLAIVVITTFDLDEYVHGALKAGARGFLLKDSGPALLIQAIHAAADGDALIAPSITARLLSAFSDVHRGRPPAHPLEPLTGREEEVLVTVAQGRTNAEIAADLHVSLSTVKTHLASIMAKLGARNRVEIVMWAYETGRVNSRSS